MITRLGLGTAQFGLDYGVTNARGQVGETSVSQILKRAAEAGITTLDTAHLYGESEAVIGRNTIDLQFRVITKTPKFEATRSDSEAVALLHTAFQESLEKLRRPSVEALLLHDPADLFGPRASALWSALEKLKAQGLVKKIGLSVYEGGEIDRVLETWPIDIIQLPWNPIDARLEHGGQFARLAANNVEVLARSVFLQGLLLQKIEDIPERFAPVRAAVAAMEQNFAEAGLTRLEGIFSLALARSDIGCFLVGVTSLPELEGILSAFCKAQAAKVGPVNCDLDPVYLNPARWSELA